MKTSRPRYLLCGLAASVAAVAFGLVALFGPKSNVEPNVDGGDYGWAGPAAVEDAKPIVDKLPRFRILGVDDDQVSQWAGPVNVRLWHAEKKLGITIPNVKQQRGDCVSWGYRNAVARLQTVGIATGTIRGPPSSFSDPFAPYFYGTSRVFIGGGRLSGDGSVGAWAQDAVKKYGVLASDASRVPAYSGSVAGQWGNPPGPPKEFVQLASGFKVETTAVMRSASDVAAAITNGYPVPICSDFGTRNFRRVDGRIVAVGDAKWAHCMCLLAYDESAPSGERYFYCLNSWGEDAHPRPLGDEPRGGFWLTHDQVDRIARQGDSFALSNFRGFPARRIDFRILAQHGTGREAGNNDDRDDQKHEDAGRPPLPRRPAARRGSGDPNLDSIRRRFSTAIVDGRRHGHSGRQPGATAIIPAFGSGGLAGIRRSHTGVAFEVGRRGFVALTSGADLLGRSADAGRGLAVELGLGDVGHQARLLDADSATAIRDRGRGLEAVPHPVFLRTGVHPLSQADSGVAGVRDEWLAGWRAADRTPADDQGGRGLLAGGQGSIREVPGRLTPYPDPDFERSRSREDYRPENVDGWLRPSDVERLDTRRPGEMDARERRVDPAERLFGPSAADLRALADRAVDRTVGEAERRIVAAARAVAYDAAVCGLVGCGCVGAACGCVLGALKLLGWLITTFVGVRRHRSAEATTNRRGQ